MADVILAALVLGPVVLTFLLKSNAALSFLALCAGFVVICFAGADLKNLTGQLNFKINSSTVNLIVLSVPLVLTLLLTRRTFSGGAARIFHLAVALCTGALLALLAVPLLGGSIRANFAHSNLWSDLRNIQSPAIGAGVFLSLIMVWSKNIKKGPGRFRKH